MPISFSDEPPVFDLDTERANPIPAPSTLDRETAAYASVLGSSDPLNNYKQIMSEMENTGQSANLHSIIGRIKQDEDKKLVETMTSILGDTKLDKASKIEALKYYESNKDVLPSLKKTYSVQAAASNVEGIFDENAAAALEAGFYKKEAAIEAIQVERNKGALVAEYKGGVEGISDVVRGIIIEGTPFAGPGRTGLLYNKMLKAINGKEYNFENVLKAAILQGDAVEIIQTAIKNIPTSEGKIAAIKRVEDVIKQYPGTNFNKYLTGLTVLEGEQAGWEKHLSNVLGIVGTAFGVRMLAKTGTKVVSKIHPDSVLGRTAAHNPEVASKMAANALVDDTGDLAEALGNKKSDIVADLLSKPIDELNSALNVEASASLRQTLSPLTEAARQKLIDTERSYILYPEEFVDSLSKGIQDTIANTKSAAVHLGKSTLHIEDTNISGSAIFGKTDTSSFYTYDDALETVNTLSGELPEGVVSVVKLGDSGALEAVGKTDQAGEYYLKYNYSKDVTAQDVELFGPDAIGIKFDLFGKHFKGMSDLLTRVALSGGKTGNYLFAHHVMPEKASNAAFSSFDKALQVEAPFLQYARRYIAGASEKNRQVVFNILKEGEDFVEGGELGKTFKYDEVIKKGLAQGLSQSEAQEVATSYYTFRHIADIMYSFADRSKSKAFREEGYKWVANTEGTRFIGKAVPESTVSDIKVVLNKQTGGVEPISAVEIQQLYKEGNTLVRMAHSFRDGDETVNFAKVEKGFKEQEIGQGALPYIKGYTPRGYKNNYFVVRTANKLKVDGHDVTNLDVLKNNRTTLAAADSQKEASKLAAKLSADDPTGTYSVKRNRTDEQSLLDHMDVTRAAKISSARRGAETVAGGDLQDPLVGLMSLVQSLSKKAALDDFLTATRVDFTRKYGDFFANPGRFPLSKTDLVAKPDMDLADSLRLKKAKSAFNWIEGMLSMQRYDVSKWKEMMYGAGEFAEKLSPVVGGLLRGLGRNYPVDILRKISTALFISLRPMRQLLLQPSQLLLYTSIEPKLLNPIRGMEFAGKLGALGLSKAYKSAGTIGEKIPDELIIWQGAKQFKQSKEEYIKTIESFKRSGLMESIDSNLLVEGIAGEGTKQLVETGLESAAHTASSTIKAIPEIGRSIGFNRGEEINLAGSWLIARDRFIRNNPGIDPNSRAAGELIAANAREFAFSMSKPGAFQYQKNALALPLQFIAAPHKSLLSLFTSKTLSSSEKGRLMGAHLAYFGAVGVGLESFVMGESGLNLRGKYGDKWPEPVFVLLSGGLANWGVNRLAHMLYDKDGEDTQLNVAQAFSPLSGGLFPIADLWDSLRSDPIATTILGPSWNIVDPQKGRVITAYRDIAGMLRGDEEITSGTFKDVAMRATELASGGTDWMKFQTARNLHIQVATNGQIVDDEITAAESVGLLMGLNTTRSGVYYENLKQFKDQEKEMQDAVKFVYDGFLKRSIVYKTEPERVQEWNKLVSAYMSLEKDESIKRAMQDEFSKYSKRLYSTTKQSVETNMMNAAQSQGKEDFDNMVRTLKSYGADEEVDMIKNLMGDD